MSYTEIYIVSKNRVELIGGTRNAFRGAMYVWNKIAEVYFGLEEFPLFDDVLQKKIWNAHKEKPLNIDEITVLASTMDDASVKKKNIPRLVEAFTNYAILHPKSSFEEQAILIDHVDIEEGELIVWNQTSVNHFNLLPQEEEHTGKIIYQDVSHLWDLFERVDEIISSKERA